MRILLLCVLFLLLLVGRLRRRRLVEDRSRQEHQRRDLLLAVGRLKLDQPIVSLAEEISVFERAAEERFHAKEVRLSPLGDQRMVMTLCTADVHTKEDDARIVRHSVEIPDA